MNTIKNQAAFLAIFLCTSTTACATNNTSSQTNVPLKFLSATKITTSIKQNNGSFLLTLIDIGKINSKTTIDENKNTLFHWGVATIKHRKIAYNIMEALLKKEENPNVINKDQKTPLHISAECDLTSDITRLLLQKKASPNPIDKLDYSPLYKAFNLKSPKNAAYLLQYGADLWSVNPNFRTPQDVMYTDFVRSKASLYTFLETLIPFKKIPKTSNILNTQKASFISFCAEAISHKPKQLLVPTIPTHQNDLLYTTYATNPVLFSLCIKFINFYLGQKKDEFPWNKTPKLTDEEKRIVSELFSKDFEELARQKKYSEKKKQNILTFYLKQLAQRISSHKTQSNNKIFFVSKKKRIKILCDLSITFSF